MCSRYALRAPQEEIVARFGLRVPPEAVPRGAIRPTNRALVIVPGPDGAGGPDSRLLRWGIPAPRDRKPLINARLEKVTRTPPFRDVAHRRCLVPAGSFDEWAHEGGGRRCVTFSLPDTPLFAFAGLRTDDHFTILTGPPNETVAAVHDRMPVIVPQDLEAAWLDPDQGTAALLDRLGPWEGAMTTDREEPAQGELFG